MKTTTLGAMCAGILFCTAFSVSHAAPILGQGTWESTLQGRDLNGDSIFDAYYDTVLDITWLADANHAGTALSWADANAWAAGLNIHGTTGWRLPDTGPVNGSSFDYTYGFDGSTDLGHNMSAPGTVYAGSTGSEMAHMYYNTLGNLGYFDISGTGAQPGWGLSNTGPFSNLLNVPYWSSLTYAPDTDNAWFFFFGDGFQDGSFKSYGYHAWAVHDGDISEVPVPAAAWLFVSGLLALIGMNRKGIHC